MKRNIANVTIIAPSSPRKGSSDKPLITKNTILVIKLTKVSIIQFNDFIIFYNNNPVIGVLLCREQISTHTVNPYSSSNL